MTDTPDLVASAERPAFALPAGTLIRFVSDDGTIDQPMQITGVQHLENGLIEYTAIDPAWRSTCAHKWFTGDAVAVPTILDGEAGR